MSLLEIDDLSVNFGTEAQPFRGRWTG